MAYSYSSEDLETISKFLNEGQNPALIFKYYGIIKQFFASFEGYANIFHQQGVLFPEIVVYTQGMRRLICYKRTITGGAKFRQYMSAICKDPYIHEGPLFSKVGWTGRPLSDLAHHALAGDPTANTAQWMKKPLYVNFIPKPQALRLHAILQEEAMFWNEEWRVRTLDWNRYASGTVVMKEGSPEIFSDWNDLNLDHLKTQDQDPVMAPVAKEAIITPELHQQMLAEVPDQDPVYMLQLSKEQLEKGLISEQEFLQRKQQMLAQI